MVSAAQYKRSAEPKQSFGVSVGFP